MGILGIVVCDIMRLYTVVLGNCVYKRNSCLKYNEGTHRYYASVGIIGLGMCDMLANSPPIPNFLNRRCHHSGCLTSCYTSI